MIIVLSSKQNILLQNIAVILNAVFNVKKMIYKNDIVSYIISKVTNFFALIGKKKMNN